MGIYDRHNYLCGLVGDIEANLINDNGNTVGAIKTAIALGKVKMIIEYADSGEVSLFDCDSELHDFVSENLQWLSETKYKEYLAR